MTTSQELEHLLQQQATKIAQLEKAQAVEAALDKVRTRTMEMQHPNELREVVAVLQEQISTLQIADWGSNILIANDAETSVELWVASFDQAQYPESYTIKGTKTQVTKEQWEHHRAKTPYFTIALTGNKKKEYDKHVFEETDMRGFPAAVKAHIYSMQEVYFSYARMAYGHVVALDSNGPLSEEKFEVLARFAKVFEQSYTRFLDLQKAEAQAREAQIETALERVRSRTMAMRQSQELAKVVKLLYEQLNIFGMMGSQSDIEIYLIEEDTGIATAWATDLNFNGMVENYQLRLKEFPVMKGEFERWCDTPMEERKNLLISTTSGGKEWQAILDYFDSIPELRPMAVSFRKANILQWTTNHAYFSHGFLALQAEQPTTPKNLDILQRFAKVFEQTYTRFLDLQKAEVQAKEAQIEAALEKVRSRSLAMHNSSEMQQVVQVMFEQMQPFGISSHATSLEIFDEAKGLIDCWFADHLNSYHITHYEISGKKNHTIRKMWKCWEAQQPNLTIHLKGAKKKKYDTYLLTETGFRNIPRALKKDIRSFKETYFNYSSMRYGLIQIVDHQPIPEENIAIVQRFAKVFEQTYTRFLDLQKAEVQARKAQIDTSIERIRAKALAMHQSQEIQEVAKVIRGELRKLGIADVLSTGIWIEHQKGQIRAWDISTIPETESQDFLMEFTYPITDAKRHPKAHFWNIMYQGKDYFTTQSDKATLYATFNWLAESDENSAKELIGLVDAGYLTQWWHAVAAFEKGVIVVDFNEAPPPEMATILPRMAAAFDLAYRRFEDLERAEAQAREAQIEAALERVRARAMAMRHSKELSEAAELLYQEFFKLGVEPFSCGYLINDDEKGEWKVWLTNPGEPFFKENWTIPYNADHNLQARYESWKNQEAFHCTVLEGAANLAHHRVICQYAPWKEEMTETLAPQLAFNSAHFSLGHLLVISPNRLAAEMEQAMVRFAGVFDLTYRRFLDLQKAEAQNRQLEKTFQENQRLLHSILPEQIAEQIRQGQQTVVKRFEEVSILFADIVGFTVLSEKLLPSKVVAILNGLFSKFDDLTDKYGLEKIKTIGDAYMVASGVPEEKDNHALVLFQFAQELLQAINDYNQIVGTDLKIRIGISSGPVVAGVIGKKKFAYDLWGDSVNTAARMEAYGREDCIQISPTSYALLKEEFKFEKIPKVEIKGKGLMDVYVWRKTGKS